MSRHQKYITPTTAGDAATEEALSNDIELRAWICIIPQVSPGADKGPTKLVSRYTIFSSVTD